MTFTRIKEIIETTRFKAVDTPKAERIKEVMKKIQKEHDQHDYKRME